MSSFPPCLEAVKKRLNGNRDQTYATIQEFEQAVRACISELGFDAVHREILMADLTIGM